jgi:hypothetical protein
MGYNAVFSVESQPTFRRNMPPSSPVSKNKQTLSPPFTLVYCSAYFFTLKMEAVCPSDTSVNTQRTTRRYIPQDGTLQVPSIVSPLYWLDWTISRLSTWDHVTETRPSYCDAISTETGAILRMISELTSNAWDCCVGKLQSDKEYITLHWNWRGWEMIGNFRNI